MLDSSANHGFLFEESNPLSESMVQTKHHSPHAHPTRQWSNRILTASLFGIAFFTLFPYWVDFSARHGRNRSPFALGGPLRFDGFLHTFLNALLFVPFGLAISQFFTPRKKSWLKCVVIAVIAGAVLSYSIEFLQFFMPSRDSAWDDVLANIFGTVLGTIFGLASGELITRKLSQWEKKLEQFLSLRRIFLAALIYFGVWCALSIPLQQKTHLHNWDPNPFLFVGSGASGDRRWSGSVSRILVWDRVLSADQALRFSRDTEFTPETDSSLLASYDLSRPPPMADKAGVLPNLVRSRFSSSPSETTPLAVRAEHSLLMSEAPVTLLSTAVRRSNQITVLIDCVPSSGNETGGVVLSIADGIGRPDLTLHQDRSTLVIDWRTGLDARKAYLSWRIPAIFAANHEHVIIFSYDGARGSVYIDGKKAWRTMNLSPGAAMVQQLVRIKTDELVAYSVLYDSLVFLPIGFLLGFAARTKPSQNPLRKLYLFTGVLVPAILLETLLVWVSGRQVSILQMVLSIGLTVVGMAWINLDSPASILRLLRSFGTESGISPMIDGPTSEA